MLSEEAKALAKVRLEHALEDLKSAKENFENSTYYKLVANRTYYVNLTKRMTKMPKLYFCDTGLCAYLCGWTNPTVLEQGAMNGVFFETMVVIELLKNFLNQGKRPPIFSIGIQSKRK